MKHLYAMYGIEQSTTTPYNQCGNAQCEQFNHTMMGLLTLLSKEQKDNSMTGQLPLWSSS